MSVLRILLLLIVILGVLADLPARNIAVSGDIDFSYAGLLADYDLAGDSLDRYYVETILNVEKKGKPVDFFYSARLNAFDSVSDGNVKILPYRYWARYSGKKTEIRLGLQKLVFGPGKVLRPLALFDTIDPSDSAKKTSGQKALRLSYFPDTSTTVQGWVIKNALNRDRVHSGGRINRIIRKGETSLTFHRWENDLNRVKEDIVGYDLFLDITVGFWIEHATHLVDAAPDYNLSTVGIDYTFEKIGNGLHAGVEHMVLSDSKFKIQTSFTSIFWDVPLNPYRSMYGIFLYADQTDTFGSIIQLRENVNDRLSAEAGLTWVNKLPSAGGTGPSPFILDRRMVMRLVYSF